jgi:hypothetical protein
MISIQDNPRFKRDCERYSRAIRECADDSIKAEIRSLYDQFLSLVKELDSGLNLLVSERIGNSTQQTDTKIRLQEVRNKLEKNLSRVKSN